MKISEDKKLEILAYESFLRRASRLDLPFMLKGSYVTRQYFPDPVLRIPNDLDWVCLKHLEYEDEATKFFNDWVIQITDPYENDGVRFRSFRENSFWRMIDYAMADDFPTVNTDLCCWVDGEEVNPLLLDISFNLPVHVPPQPLLYKPLRGESFTIPNAVPLALQVSWKLHQTLVRARFKDIFDLMHLVVHPAFTTEILQLSISEMIKECALDNTDPGRIQYLLNGDWQEIFHIKDVEIEWDFWRHEKRHPNSGYLPAHLEETASRITEAEKLPVSLSEFIGQFRLAFQSAGFYNIDFESLNKRSQGITVKDYFSDEDLPETNLLEKKQSTWMQLLRRVFKTK